jgi:peptidoglycan L-alanyl-D-glutamate endopeptidase CwlK
VPTPAAPAAPAVDPDQRDVELDRLHPVFREKVEAVMAELRSAGIPMKVFEAWRSPERQRMLFGKGRAHGRIADRSKVVTFADAWHSYHQFGLAVDMVIDNPPMNPWETRGEAAEWWRRYHEIARGHGLEPLSFELPHIQIAGTRSSLLLAGEYPEGGDGTWANALAEAIMRWPDRPKPPVRRDSERPAIAAADIVAPAAAGVDWAGLPPIREFPFAGRFGGQSWRVDGRGVFLAGAPAAPQRTPGTPQTASRIVELYGSPIAKAAAKYGLAPELLVMTIATETAAFRQSDFTGPDTFRWEAHFRLRNTGDASVDGRETGDYSAGPMQVMADTARGVNRQENLGYDAETVFRFFRNKPSKPPATLGLYDPAVCIDVGACCIRRQLAETEGNPVLVAAAYNAGSLRASGTNLWGIHAHGDHLDRACRWFGDACEVLAAFGR